MNIYDSIIVLILIGIFFSVKQRKTINTIYYWIVCIVLILACGMRNEIIGIDTWGYLKLFENPNGFQHHYQYDATMEPGIKIVNYLLSFLVFDSHLYQLLVTALFMFPVFFLYKKYSTRPMLSLFLYVTFSVGLSVYLLSWNVMRQSLAEGIWALLLYYYCQNKGNIKNKEFVLLTICMLLCHYTSILGLILIAVDKMRFSKKIFLVCVVLASIMGYLMSFFSSYIQLLLSKFGMNTFYFTNVFGKSYSVMSLLPFIAVALYAVWVCSEEKLNALPSKAFFLSLLMMGIMGFYGNNVDRMCAYFYIPAFLEMPFFSIKGVHNKAVARLVLCVVIIYFTHRYFSSIASASAGGHNFIPYKTWL